MKNVQNALGKIRSLSTISRVLLLSSVIIIAFFTVYGVAAAYEDVSNRVNSIVYERLETVYIKDISQILVDTDGDNEPDVLITGLSNQAGYRELAGEEVFLSLQGDIEERPGE